MQIQLQLHAWLLVNSNYIKFYYSLLMWSALHCFKKWWLFTTVCKLNLHRKGGEKDWERQKLESLHTVDVVIYIHSAFKHETIHSIHAASGKGLCYLFTLTYLNKQNFSIFS